MGESLLEEWIWEKRIYRRAQMERRRGIDRSDTKLGMTKATTNAANCTAAH